MAKGWPATSGRSLAAARSLKNCGLAAFFLFFWFFNIFLISFLDVKRKFGDGPSILGEWVYNTLIF
jgi:hypothetical protein